MAAIRATKMPYERLICEGPGLSMILKRTSRADSAPIPIRMRELGYGIATLVAKSSRPTTTRPAMASRAISLARSVASQPLPPIENPAMLTWYHSSQTEIKRTSDQPEATHVPRDTVAGSNEREGVVFKVLLLLAGADGESPGTSRRYCTPAGTATGRTGAWFAPAGRFPARDPRTQVRPATI